MTLAAACPTRKTPVPSGFRDFEERLGDRNAGVVDKNVELSESADDFRHSCRNRRGIADIHRDGDCVATGAANFITNRLQALAPARRHHHRCSGARARLRNSGRGHAKPRHQSGPPGSSKFHSAQ
jgi:hypothetical protein